MNSHDEGAFVVVTARCIISFLFRSFFFFSFFWSPDRLTIERGLDTGRWNYCQAISPRIETIVEKHKRALLSSRGSNESARGGGGGAGDSSCEITLIQREITVIVKCTLWNYIPYIEGRFVVKRLILWIRREAAFDVGSLRASLMHIIVEIPPW